MPLMTILRKVMESGLKESGEDPVDAKIKSIEMIQPLRGILWPLVPLVCPLEAAEYVVAKQKKDAKTEAEKELAHTAELTLEVVDLASEAIHEVAEHIDDVADWFY